MRARTRARERERNERTRRSVQSRPPLSVLDPAVCPLEFDELAHEGIVALEDGVDEPEREGEPFVEVEVRLRLLLLGGRRRGGGDGHRERDRHGRRDVSLHRVPAEASRLRGEYGLWLRSTFCFSHHLTDFRSARGDLASDLKLRLEKGETRQRSRELDRSGTPSRGNLSPVRALARVCASSQRFLEFGRETPEVAGAESSGSRWIRLSRTLTATLTVALHRSGCTALSLIQNRPSASGTV